MILRRLRLQDMAAEPSLLYLQACWPKLMPEQGQDCWQGQLGAAGQQPQQEAVGRGRWQSLCLSVGQAVGM